MVKSQSQRGFTLIELLVVISVIVLLMALLLPALVGARESAKSVSCATKLRSLSQLMLGYADNFNNMAPPGQISYGSGYGSPGGVDAAWNFPSNAQSWFPYGPNFCTFLYSYSIGYDKLFDARNLNAGSSPPGGGSLAAWKGMFQCSSSPIPNASWWQWNYSANPNLFIDSQQIVVAGRPTTVKMNVVSNPSAFIAMADSCSAYVKSSTANGMAPATFRWTYTYSGAPYSSSQLPGYYYGSVSGGNPVLSYVMVPQDSTGYGNYDGAWDLSIWDASVRYRHGPATKQYANASFADGHAERIQQNKLYVANVVP